jgi:hypothetical protein
MGDVKKKNSALTIDMLLGLQDLLEDDYRTLFESNCSPEEMFETVLLGTAATVAFGISLRGEELARCVLADSLAGSSQGAVHKRVAHSVIALRGRFKLRMGGNREYAFPLPEVSYSGIQYRRWLYRLFKLFVDSNIEEGPLFRPSLRSKSAATIRELDVLFHRALERLRSRRSDLFAAGLDIGDSYSFYRSLRSGGNSQATNRKTPEELRTLIARWRIEDRARQKKPSLSMPEHYTDVAVVLEAVIVYPQNM